MTIETTMGETDMFSQPDAVERIKRANLKPGSWGGTETVCMMSALISGAKCTEDCVTAGWPEWMVPLNVDLFDAAAGAEDEDDARREFALSVALAVQTPRDMDRARDLFLIATIERSKARDTAGVTQPVIDLLHRRIAGEDVRDEMKAAARAAYAACAACAADAASYAACAAACAASYTASYTASAVGTAARAAARAAYAARAAVCVACEAARAAARAAYAAARADLIKALNAA